MTDVFEVHLSAVKAFASSCYASSDIFLHFDPASDYTKVTNLPKARFLEVVGTYFDEDDLPGTCERLNAALARWRDEQSSPAGVSLVEVLDDMKKHAGDVTDAFGRFMTGAEIDGWEAAVQHLRDLIDAGRITHV